MNKILLNKKKQIFHAGTYKKNEKTFSKGGRVLNITCADEKLSSTRENSLEILEKINWKDGFFRKDIGWKVIKDDENN